MIDTGRLRRSVSSRTTENSITFYTDLPYAVIHNDGGEIRVTKKMKRYFGINTTRRPVLSGAGRMERNARTNVPCS